MRQPSAAGGREGDGFGPANGDVALAAHLVEDRGNPMIADFGQLGQLGLDVTVEIKHLHARLTEGGEDFGHDVGVKRERNGQLEAAILLAGAGLFTTECGCGLGHVLRGSD